MRNLRAYPQQTLFRGCSICILFCLLMGSCGSSKRGNRQPTASVAVDKTTVTLGEEIRITPDRSLQGWSGEATVNTFRGRLPINPQNNAVRVTRDNGFVLAVSNDVCVTLKDATGKDVRVSNPCVPVHVNAPAFDLKPDSDTVSSNGGSGVIGVHAPSDRQLQIERVPDWVTFKIGTDVGNDPVIRYSVPENKSYRARSASIPIGDAKFELTQWGSPYVELPYTADFTKAPIPVWELVAADFKVGKSHDTPPDWVLDNQKGEEATVTTSSEAPAGNGALVVDRDLPSAQPWKTMLWLPGIKTQQGGRYKASIWLKSENPVSIGLEFGQKTDPYAGCGFFRWVDAPSKWKQFTVDFIAKGASCGADNNRFSIHAGRVFGKLWIAGFSLAKD